MVPQELTAYIQTELQKHVAESAIRTTLQAQGWTQVQLDEAFIPFMPKNPLPPGTVETPPEIDTSLDPIENTSGMGKEALIPEEVKGWSWAGFLLSWVWAVRNHIWIGLLALISPLGLLVQLILGIKGNEWAWRNIHWESIDQFKASQKRWATWGFILNGLSIVILLLMIPVILLAINPQRQIEKAACMRNCQLTHDASTCVSFCQIATANPSDLQESSMTNGLTPEGDATGNDTLTPASQTVASSTPAPTIAPTSTPTPTSAATAAPTSTPAPTPAKYQSSGVQTLENGVTGVVSSATLTNNVVTIQITFKNTSGTEQTANLIHVQMHDETLAGTAPKENYMNAILAAGESRKFTMSFDALPKPPFKIQYAKDDGGLVTFGTYTP